MHRSFKTALASAEGDSQLVIAVFVDVRDFSQFNTQVDAVESALFIRRIYKVILDDYFPDAAFFKPTGDGLLIILAVDPPEIVEQSTRVVRTCIRLVREFRTLCDADPLINFPVPERIGIGIARGAASRLHSRTLTLDYSGRVLNLAARLLDLARPQGIVIDGAFKVELLPASIRKQFEEAKVYVRGIATKNAIPVYFLAALTNIPEAAKRPIDVVKWRRIEEKLLSKEVTRRGTTFIHSLPSLPSESTRISVKLRYPIEPPKGPKTLMKVATLSAFEYYVDGDDPKLRIDYGEIRQRLLRAKVKQTWPVTLEILYPE